MNNQRSSVEIKGFFTLLLGGFLYSLYPVFSRLIGDSIDSFFQYTSRGIIIALSLMLLMFLYKIPLKRIQTNDLRWVLIIACSSGLLMPAFFISINNLPIGTTLFIFYALSTIVGYVLGRVLLREKFSKVKTISFVLALLGLLLMFLENITLGNGPYMILAAFSGMFFGVNISTVRKLSPHYHFLQINLFNWIGIVAISLPISLLLGDYWFFSPTSVPWMANIALALCSLAASLSVVYGFRFIEVQKGSIILLSELVYGVIIGLLFYNEVPTLLTALGSVFVFIALLLPNINPEIIGIKKQ